MSLRTLLSAGTAQNGTATYADREQLTVPIDPAAPRCLVPGGPPVKMGEFSGFRRPDLNGRYILREDMPLQGHGSYWGPGNQTFAYLQQGMKRWSICGRDAYSEVAAGQARGWAYQLEEADFTQQSRWLELTGNSWTEAPVRVVAMGGNAEVPSWQAVQDQGPAAQRVSRRTLDVSGFQTAELNGRYTENFDVMLHGAATFWDMAGRRYVYWQAPMSRWAICGVEVIDRVKGGECPGWACQLDLVEITSPGRWVELIDGDWQCRNITVIATGDFAGITAGAWAATAAAATTQGSQGGARETASDGAAATQGRTRPAVHDNGKEDGNSWKRPRWEENANAGDAAAGAKWKSDDNSTLPEVDWSKVQRHPVRRNFIPYTVTATPASASEQRAALHIEVEEDPDGEGATPVPIKSFHDVDVFPPWVIYAMQGNGWDAPMPIQAQALPILLAGRNIIGIGQTGSGKTGAFLLPAIVHIAAQERLTRDKPGPICLVLAPTRELAVQISNEAEKLLKPSSSSEYQLRSTVFYGGGHKGSQLRQYTYEGSHVLVATPGRLTDFLSDRCITLQRVTYFVLDEADRMLDLGFSGDIATISAQVRPERQTAFFSATWPNEVRAFAYELCDQAPVRIRVGQKTFAAGHTLKLTGEAGEEQVIVPEGITQEVVVLEGDWKKAEEDKKAQIFAHVRKVLKEDPEHKVLVFVNQKSQADELSTQFWDEGFKADAIHGGRTQDRRLLVLEQFRTGEVQLLIATDVIGRGLDIPKVSHVVVHSMCSVCDYVHRIGRTGRGKDGKGHALVFFEYSRSIPTCAAELISVLAHAKQPVPEALTRIADDVKQGKMEVKSWGGGGAWKSDWKKKEWTSEKKDWNAATTEKKDWNADGGWKSSWNNQDSNGKKSWEAGGNGDAGAAKHSSSGDAYADAFAAALGHRPLPAPAWAPSAPPRAFQWKPSPYATSQ